MKRIGRISGLAALTAGIALSWGCSTAARTQASAYDDIYNTHDRAAIARAEAREAERARAQAEAEARAYEARNRQLQDEIAALKAQQATSGSASQSAVAVDDDFQSIYERKLYAFDAPVYVRPSSYYAFSYATDAFWAAGLDPFYYNIAVAGGRVWVSPRYSIGLYGYWGAPVCYDPWYYGWRSPYYDPWPYYGWGASWNSWYGGWGFYWSSRPPYQRPPAWGGPPPPPRRPVAYRPNEYRGSGSSASSGRPSYNPAPGRTQQGGASPATSSGARTGSYRNSAPAQSAPSGTSGSGSGSYRNNRDGNSTSDRNETGKSETKTNTNTRNRNQSSSGSSSGSYRNNQGSSSSPSYNPSPSPSPSSSPSSSGGSSPSSGGGSSRNR